MISDHIPARAKGALSILGLVVSLCSLTVIILFLAGARLDLRPYGWKVYVEDLRNPSLLFLAGIFIFAAFHPAARLFVSRLFKSLRGHFLEPARIPLPSLDQTRPILAHGAALAAVALLALLLPYKIYLAPDSSWPIAEPIRYLALGAYFQEAREAGYFYPRWLPDLYFGYGYPTFVFYPAGYFFLSAGTGYVADLAGGIFSIPVNLAAREWITLSLILSIGGMGAYLLCRLFAGAHFGLACALIFLISPYALSNLQFRNDYSELLSMMLCPYVFYFFLRMMEAVAQGSSKCALYSLLFGGALALAFISHPAIALFLAAGAFVYGALVILFAGGRGSAAGGLLFISGFALGLALSSPYWLHALLLKNQVYLTAATGHNHDVNRWIAQPIDFFRRDPSGGNFYQLGLPNFILALMGAFMGRRDPRVWAAFAIYAGAILAMTSLGRGFWSYFDLVRYVQFPWRSQAVLASLQIICAAGAVSRLTPAGKGRAAAGYLAVILCAGWYAGSFIPPAAGLPNYFQAELMALLQERREDPDPRKNSYSDKVEFAPLHSLVLVHPLSVRMKTIPRPNELLQAESGEASLTPAGDNSKYRIHYLAKSPAGAGLRINQVYFPGWKVWVDGKALGDRELSSGAQEEGIMKFSVGPGEHDVLAYYEGPPYWRERNAAILLVAGLHLLIMALANARYLPPRKFP